MRGLLITHTMRKLMSTDRSKCTVAEVLRNTRVIEYRSLHYSGRKDYFVSSWIVISLADVSFAFQSSEACMILAMSRTLTASAPIP